MLLKSLSLDLVRIKGDTEYYLVYNDMYKFEHQRTLSNIFRHAVRNMDTNIFSLQDHTHMYLFKIYVG